MLKKIFFILFFLFIFVLPNEAWADFIPSGHKHVDYCFHIEDIERYPNYYFILSGDGGGSYADGILDYSRLVTTSDECFAVGGWGGVTLYAVEKNNFNKYIEDWGKKNQCVDWWSDSNNISLIIGESFGQGISNLPESDRINSLIEVYRVKRNFYGNFFYSTEKRYNDSDIYKTNIIVLWDKDICNGEVYKISDIKENHYIILNKIGLNKYSFYYFTIPLLAMVGLVFYFVKKIKK